MPELAVGDLVVILHRGTTVLVESPEGGKTYQGVYPRGTITSIGGQCEVGVTLEGSEEHVCCLRDDILRVPAQHR